MDLLENKVVKTRKQHKCDTCFRLFPKGSNMTYQASVDGGEWYHTYLCETCQTFINKTWKENSWFFENEPLTDSFKDTFEDEWESVRKEIESE